MLMVNICFIVITIQQGAPHKSAVVTSTNRIQVACISLSAWKYTDLCNFALNSSLYRSGPRVRYTDADQMVKHVNVNGVWRNCFRFTYSFGVMAEKNGGRKNECKFPLIKCVYTFHWWRLCGNRGLSIFRGTPLVRRQLLRKWKRELHGFAAGSAFQIGNVDVTSNGNAHSFRLTIACTHYS